MSILPFFVAAYGDGLAKTADKVAEICRHVPFIVIQPPEQTRLSEAAGLALGLEENQDVVLANWTQGRN